MGADLELHKLVDLALRSPDAGVVNFNHLHTLLHAILNHIGLRYDPQSGVLKPQKNDFAEEADKTTSTEQSVVVEKDEVKKEQSNGTGNDSVLSNQASPSERTLVDSLQCRHDDLEKKVNKLEERLKLLDELPSNRTIIEQAQQTDSSMVDSGTNHSTLSGIWHFMKINSRLQAIEDAIDQVMSILNEFLGNGGKTVNELRKDVSDLVKEVTNLRDHFHGSTMGTRPGENTSLGQHSGSNRDRLYDNNFVTKDDLLLYVQWPALEKALNVKKSDIDQLSKHGESSESHEKLLPGDNDSHVSDTSSDGRPHTAPVPSTFETPVESTEVPKTAFVRSHEARPRQDGSSEEKLAVGHPSQEMVECLRQIGELSEKHDAVVKNVRSLAKSQKEIAEEMAKVEQTLPQKVNKEELKIPDDLQDQLAMLKQGLEFLNTNQDLVAIAEIKKRALDNKEHIETIKRELAMIARQNKSAFSGVRHAVSPTGIDSSVLDAIRGHLDELQTEQEKFALQTESKHTEVVEDLNRKQDHIEALYSYVEKLQESKADKENVALEMDVKADKEALDSKVNVSTFDNTFNMLDEGIREALQKMDDYMNEETALKQALKQLSLDMSEKMDGQEFQALKNYLERRIADVQKSRSLIAAETKMDFSDAAGFRKSVKFNCISCSRPVEVPIKGATQPNMPVPRGVRTKRSKGPYLSYEMDQIRQYQRGHYGHSKADRTLNDIVTGRPCGGSHTVMYHPKRRSTKVTQLNQVLARDDAPEVPNWGRELSVVEFLKGSDGLVYKGRFRQTIPPISKGFQPSAHEREFSPFVKDESQYMSPRSEPNSPRESSGQPEPETYMDRIDRKGSPQEGHQINITSHASSPRTRMRYIVKRHSSGSPPLPVPSPSPPTVRENEFHQAQLKQQKQEVLKQEGQSKLFSPAPPRTKPDKTEGFEPAGNRTMDQNHENEQVISATREQSGNEQTPSRRSVSSRCSV